MTVLQFVARRLALTIPLLLGIIFITFMLIRIGGQDAVGMLTSPLASKQEVDAIRASLGLDRPLLEQFAIYIGNVLQGDLGNSWQSKQPVLGEILRRLPASIELLFLSIILGAAIGIPIGLRAAMRPNGLFDQVSRFVSLIGFSVPTYWMALMALFVFYLGLRWTPPPMGRISIAAFPPKPVTGSYFLDSLFAGDWSAASSAGHYLILPVAVFSLIVAAPIIKQTRAIAIEILNSDYVRLARLYGFRPQTIRRLTLRNAFTPIATYIGSELATLLAAVSLVELVFSWGGLGQWGLNAILFGDFAAVQGYVLTLAIFATTIYLLVDVAVLVLEPRSAISK
ncbi:MAG: ABC transporter permease [Alphaproteobacteria bacterium]|nr:ABC transporter permease [Alphaproteobacteria bacterium]